MADDDEPIADAEQHIKVHFVLDDEQWAEFIATLDRPARVLPQVRELFERPRPV